MLGGRVNSAQFRPFLPAAALAAAVLLAACSAEIRPSSAAISARCTEIPASAFDIDASRVTTHTPFARQHFQERLSEFSRQPLACGEVVMLGDSLTELNDWTASLPAGASVRNRGISGDTTDGLLLRMDEIYARKPKAVFLLIGTNDLWTRETSGRIASNILGIAGRIRDQSPNSVIFVQTLPPLRGEPATWGGEPNRKVREVNALLAKGRGQSGLVVIDVYAAMTDEAGELNAAYTADGLHFNAQGYAVWSGLVAAALSQHGLLATTND